MRHRLALALSALTLAVLCACGSGPEKKAAAPVKAPPKILQFYASQGAIRPGESVTICYGVESAESVRIEPHVEDITPSLNRCIEATPAKTTLYTLTAAGAEAQDEASFTVTVDPNARPAVEASSPSPLIQFFMASATTAGKGRPITLCYGVKGAASVSLSPNLRALEPGERECFSATFDQTTTLTLTAKSARGVTDTEKLTITIQ